MLNLKNVKYAVEANSFEATQLWSNWNKRVEWEDNRSGVGVSVEGRVNSFVSLLITKINNVEVLFYEATSVLVDHKAVEDWVLLNCPSLTRRNMNDAQNFHNTVISIENLKEKYNGQNRTALDTCL